MPRLGEMTALAGSHCALLCQGTFKCSQICAPHNTRDGGGVNPPHPILTSQHLNTWGPANRGQSAGVVLMLGHRRRRWPYIKTTPAGCLVFAVCCHYFVTYCGLVIGQHSYATNHVCQIQVNIIVKVIHEFPLSPNLLGSPCYYTYT